MKGEKTMEQSRDSNTTDILKAIRQAEYLGYMKAVEDRMQRLWIPCSERLPEKEGIYLVTATNYIFDTEEIAVGTCYFNTEYGFSNNGKILAWIPLPKPWKGADD